MTAVAGKRMHTRAVFPGATLRNLIFRRLTKLVAIPAAGTQRMPASSAAQFGGHRRIIHAFCCDDAANAESDNGERTLTPLRFAEVGLEDVDELLQNLPISLFYRVAAAHDIR
jgi:hypothetical protein